MTNQRKVVLEGCIYGDTVVRRGKCAFLLATEDVRLVPCIMGCDDTDTPKQLKGGQIVTVTGTFRNRGYLAKDFQDRMITELVVSNIN